MSALSVGVAIAVGACGQSDGEGGSTMPRVPSNALVTLASSTTTTIPTSYVIQEGDTLSAIAARFHVDVNALATLNGIVNPDDIEAGQTLQLPPASPTTTTTVGA
ncbi:LysM peptidoglycan-binding domain-containing protein [Desertimonas flava]|jgi:LysM repeat protein|uniref:LysM peptidoglycan-binding domain-containing protein n=1 Tax=Desertimonas flava TaxID=2064846 RepID=UPI0019695EA2|nr:LysM domain-containing protein [Desertimonas flava]